MPRVSVLLPVRDALSTLPECLASLCAQTLADHEDASVRLLAVTWSGCVSQGFLESGWFFAGHSSHNRLPIRLLLKTRRKRLHEGPELLQREILIQKIANDQASRIDQGRIAVYVEFGASRQQPGSRDRVRCAEAGEHLLKE